MSDNHSKHVLNFAKNYLDKLGKEQVFDNGFDAFLKLRDALDHIVKRHESLNEKFDELKLDDFWAECPDCESPVLLEFGNCPFCDANLLGEEVINEQEEEEVIEKPAKKKKKAKPEPVEEEPVEVDSDEEELDALSEEDIDLDDGEESEEISDDADEVGEDADDELDEEDTAPSAEEVNKMKKADLIALIEEYDLDIDPKGVKIKELREEINDALDELFAEEEEDEDIVDEDDEEIDLEDEDEDEEDEDEEDEDEEEEEEDDDDDLDLDGVDFSELDDLENLDLEDE
jgi:hypothetical protein